MADVVSGGEVKMDFESEISKYMNTKLKPNIDEAVKASAEVVRNAMEASSPYRPSDGSPHLKDCWVVLNYHYLAIIGNTKRSYTNKGLPKGIPLTNLLEYGKKGHPFIKMTFDSCYPQAINEFKIKIKGGL